MTAAMYATIWAALILFVAGESGKRRMAASGIHSWAWRAWTAGACLCAMHIAIAMAVHHQWSHHHAVEETAARTAAVYGAGWRGGLYVNYLFLARWIAEAVWWGSFPVTYAARNASIVRALRVFDFIILINAVVIFASPPGRVAGVLLVLWLLRAWRRDRTEPRISAAAA